MSTRIKANFYMIGGYKYQRITKADRENMSPEEREAWKDKQYWFVRKYLPDGRLYSGWRFSHPTKLTAEDLPAYYILLTNYKKYGYIRTAGVKGLIYHPSPFHNHAFKDDFLFISYDHQLGEYNEATTWDECDEYIFGNDIVKFIAAVDIWSPGIDMSKIKKMMVDQYNAYCDEVGHSNKIENFENLT